VTAAPEPTAVQNSGQKSVAKVSIDLASFLLPSRPGSGLPCLV
jgi:hypothetical protein